MRILNYGSVNIDHVYAVEHFVRPGETLASADYRRFPGGKGFNQSMALARAGADVWHAGKIGPEGSTLREELGQAGAHTEFLFSTETPTGHAIIQVAPNGENAIVLYGGANQTIAESDISVVLDHFRPGDLLLVQNETSNVPCMIAAANRKGLRVAFNPAPMSPEVLDYPLDQVDIFILNEVEAEGLTGCAEAEAAMAALRERFPAATIVLTLGAEGVVFAGDNEMIRVPAVRVDAVDTTAAGDTFIGYFLAGMAAGCDMPGNLRLACRAAAISVTRPGASTSIPMRSEVEEA